MQLEDDAGRYPRGGRGGQPRSENMIVIVRDDIWYEAIRFAKATGCSAMDGYEFLLMQRQGSAVAIGIMVSSRRLVDLFGLWSGAPDINSLASAVEAALANHAAEHITRLGLDHPFKPQGFHSMLPSAIREPPA